MIIKSKDLSVTANNRDFLQGFVKDIKFKFMIVSIIIYYV